MRPFHYYSLDGEPPLTAPCVENRTRECWWRCLVCGGDFAPQQATMYWDGRRWIGSACLQHPVDPKLFHAEDLQ